MRAETHNHGFIPDEIKPEDYVFGSHQAPTDVLQEDGQWDEFLPEDEIQKRNGLETMNCTVYGTLNCIEILMHRVFGTRENYSERYVGVIAETTRGGNSPHKVVEVIRKESGVIEDELLPFSDDVNEWEEYYSPKPMTPQYLAEGRKWLNQYELKHDWVFTNGRSIEEKRAALMLALKTSPIGVSVFAWSKESRDSDIYIKPSGFRDNHWVTLYGYEEGKHWKVFDHYDDTHKKLSWDYNFGFAKRYSIVELPDDRKEDNWLQELIEGILDLLRSLFLIPKSV